MNTISYIRLKTFITIVCLSFFITGCNPLIIIEEGKDSTV